MADRKVKGRGSNKSEPKGSTEGSEPKENNNNNNKIDTDMIENLIDGNKTYIRPSFWTVFIKRTFKLGY